MASQRDLTEADLIFSSASTSIKTVLHELRRSHLSIQNRLQSIQSDADYVRALAGHYQLPVVANERCGSWYVHPEIKAGSAYFKSTDGHTGQWSFSLRRLNTQLLGIVGAHQGCIIVDSTRRGKSMPDALSKTVPIWCCVMNRVLFPQSIGAHELQTPADVVSGSEHAQIAARINGFVQDLNGLGVNYEHLRDMLGHKPMQVSWHRPGDPLSEPPLDNACNRIVLCTASNCTSGEMTSLSTYVQGAADDSESWALGLDPVTFWANSEVLLAESEDALPERIQSLLLASQTASKSPGDPTWIGKGSNVAITDSMTLKHHVDSFDIVIACDTHADVQLSEKRNHRYIHLNCTTGKVGSRQLRTELVKLSAVGSILKPDTKVLIACQTGRDLSVGVALAVVCLYCDNHIALIGDGQDNRSVINKTYIKQRLSWIMVSMPTASPSRATLQSVNAYLME